MGDPFTKMGYDGLYDLHSLTILPADGVVHNFRLSDEDALLLQAQIKWALEGYVGPMPGDDSQEVRK